VRGSAGNARLLPWTGPEGKPCHLTTDGTGCLSRRADAIESAQLGMAGELLGHAADMLAGHRATSAQPRFLLARMHEAPTDVRRTAESRDARPPTPAHDGPDSSQDPEDI
jgi:hypothetical protein